MLWPFVHRSSLFRSFTHRFFFFRVSQYRFFASTLTPEEQFDGNIPREKLTITFSRSSGAGGQNVNKVSTKVDIRFKVDSADWLPEHVRERLKAIKSNKINNAGELVIQASVHRTQEQNLKDAMDRLTEYIREAYIIPKERIIKLERSAKGDAKRLKEKKYHSEKKAGRRVSFRDFNY
jgi:peptidyl-tRNA hydrolase ICT1